MIQDRNKGKKRGRPFGDRTVELGFDLCFQQKPYPRVGGEEKIAAIAVSARDRRNRKTLPSTTLDDTDDANGTLRVGAGQDGGG